MKITLVSLGCPKNLADSESLVRRASATGISYTDDPEEADVLMVNTCGFIEDAKRESIEEIIELSKAKHGGKRLVVIGCLAGKYSQDLKSEMPEIDALFGAGQEEAVVEYLATIADTQADTRKPAPEAEDDVFLIRGASAPLKAAEGCSRKCAFCVIPSIRGPFRSRKPEDVLKDAERYVKAGVRELMVVAQDLSSYGAEYKGYGLHNLLRDIASIEGEFWVRPMYLHPTRITDRLLAVIAKEPKIVKYIDMPIQHSEGRILKAMGRKGGHREYLQLVRHIRESVPDVTLRTTVLVGFPGETDADHQKLMRFLDKAAFDRLGVFTYSREPDTPAAEMPGQVAARVKRARAKDVMKLQAGVSLRQNQKLVGRELTVLIEEIQGEVAIARTGGQAPEIDGVTLIADPSGETALRPGEFAEVRITGADAYDLRAEAL